MGLIVPNGLGTFCQQNGLAENAHKKWLYVVSRFSEFLLNIRLTPNQQSDGFTKKNGVIECLNRAYYDIHSESDNAFFAGSWGKDTVVRPPRDIDIYFILPLKDYSRFDGYRGNKQSAILQEVKSILQKSYPTTTDIRGDGPVVYVGFDSYRVEVVPAFEYENSKYIVCDTSNGGTYKQSAPWHELAYIEKADARSASNVRPLIRMLKVWQAYCSVPLKSFYLELLAIEYIDQSPWRDRGLLWYDWLVRDFFKYLIGRANTFINIPGTGELIWLGEGWKTKAESAFARASNACEYEMNNLMIIAGEEWQKIFGLDIPRTVTL